MDRRYQVFVSSTFRDLVEERKVALDAILELGHFPAGMEIFPAADQTAWDLIERVIQDCDYYILIVGGRYGSTGADGISYTEKEYDLATKRGIPILAFLHRDPRAIPSGNSELEPRVRKKLDVFRRKVEKHHCKYWTSSSELKAAIALGLVHEIRLKPRVGWTRADGVENTELLKQINELRLRLEAQLDENGRLKTALEKVSSCEIIPSHFMISKEQLLGLIDVPEEISNEWSEVRHFALFWQPLFRSVGIEMLVPLDGARFELQVASKLVEYTKNFVGNGERSGEIAVRSRRDKKFLQRLAAFWIQMDIIEPVESQAGMLQRSVAWRLTSRGKELFSKLELENDEIAETAKPYLSSSPG